MATTPTKASLEAASEFMGKSVPGWPRTPGPVPEAAFPGEVEPAPSGRNALQALLAFSALHDHVRRRRVLAARQGGFETIALPEFESGELFVLDEVLQLVAERAIAITGADGLAIALAENNDIVLRASAGAIRPDVGARIDRDSAFSGACFRTAQIVQADDTETDDRVNLQACRRLGARSMVAVPLCGRRRVIGLIEAFSDEPFGFNDSDVRSLELLAEIILGALKPEDEDRFAEAAQRAATKLDSVPSAAVVAAEPAALREKPSAMLEPKTPAQKAAEQPPAKPGLATKPALPGTTPALDSVASLISDLVIEKLPERTKVVEPKFPEPRISTPRVAEPRIAEPKVVAPKIAEPKSVEPKIAAATSPDTIFADAAVVAQEQKSHRPGVLLVLVFLMVAAVVAGGIWLKLNNDQLGSSMVQPRKPELKPVSPQPGSGSAGRDSEAQSSSAAATEITSDSLSAAEPEMKPATPQELSKFPRVTGVRHWASGEATTVVLDLEDQVQYEGHHISGPERTFFDLRETALAPELAGKSIDVGDALLSRIRVAQPVPGMTRVVLDTKSNAKVSVSLEPNPYRLVLQVSKVGTSPNNSVELFPSAGAEKSLMAIVIPPPTKEDMQLRARVPKMRIAVDAGHGGWDLGTVGRRGLLEKDLVLEVAQRLGKLLESRLGAEIIYTRQDDTYIPLDERAGIANQAQADLFVSVHANYSDLPSARGVETYFTSSFSSPNAKEKDEDTRASANGKNAVAVTLSPAELHEKIEQSRRLAASVQHSLYGTLAAKNPGLRDRGVKEAGFVVLTETAMPGILAEVSFVSSPTDEQKLRSDGYREQIAEALYRGIARYAASSRGVKVAAK